METYITIISSFFQDLFSGLINKILIALIILLIGFILGKVASRITHKTLKEIKLNKIISEASGIKISFEEIISHFILYFIYFISIIMTLRHIGIATDILNILSGAIIILIGIFILMSVKDFIPNIISGIIIHQRNIINEGDIIIINNIKGKVISLTLLETKLKTNSNDIIIIPNSNLTKNEIIKKASKKRKN
jgi:small-conductance mechanosensitive channel